MQKLHNIPPASLQVAYQIYERWNGSGYPRGRGGIQINIMARVAAVCDTFVSLTTQKKQTRAPEKYGAITRIVDMTRKGLFDPTAVRGLLQTVSLYPLGSFVVLNDGCTGPGDAHQPHTYDRPVVQLVNPFTGDLTSSTLDLSTHTHLKVIEVNEEIQHAFAA